MTKCGVPQDVREKIVQLTFGTEGVSTATDSTLFDARVAMLMQYARQANVDVVEYLQTCIIPKS